MHPCLPEWQSWAHHRYQAGLLRQFVQPRSRLQLQSQSVCQPREQQCEILEILIRDVGEYPDASEPIPQKLLWLCLT